MMAEEKVRSGDPGGQERCLDLNELRGSGVEYHMEAAEVEGKISFGSAGQEGLAEAMELKHSRSLEGEEALFVG